MLNYRSYLVLGLFALSASVSAQTPILGPISAKLAAMTPTQTQTLPTVEVYKSASCGCCSLWVEHLEKHGFTVKAHDVDNLMPYKEKAQLGPGMGSCHTAFVDGYAIEGHVPARDIKRLLLEKPDVAGLTVPRMPIGSPGMEVEGRTSDAYQVISYKDGKQIGVFSDYAAGENSSD